MKRFHGSRLSAETHKMQTGMAESAVISSDEFVRFFPFLFRLRGL